MDRWEFSHGIVGVNAPSWLTFEVHRPYFDGAESPNTVIHARASVLAARRFEHRDPTALRFGMSMPASYRQLLVEESRLDAYRVRDPAGLPATLASPAWRRLAEAFAGRAKLDAVDRAGLASWLVAVCLPAAVLDVVPGDLDPVDCAEPVPATIQAARAAALFQLEGFSERATTAYRQLVDNPANTVAHVQAVAGWGYLLFRHAGDDGAAPLHLRRARQLFKNLSGALGDFVQAILSARLALREVMSIERQGDLTGAAQLLADAADCLGTAAPADENDELLLLEARRRLIDRQVEIAVRQGDEDTAQRAVDAGIELDPTCVKIRIQAAQAAQRRGEHEQALAGYLLASRLGPYGTGFALLRAAECAQQLGHDEFARVLYERAFRAAPRSLRTRDALMDACTVAGDKPLADVVRRAGQRNPARPYENNWHYQMYASYFNLGESRSPCLYARLPTLAYEFAERGAPPEVNWQRLMPPAFRGNLVRQSGLTGFAVTHPADLAEELRTPAWDKLCEWVAQFPDTDVPRRHLTAVVLFRLGFGRLVLDLVPDRPVGELRTPAELRLHHWRDLVQYITWVGSKLIAPVRSFEIAQRPDCPAQLRFVIAMFAVVFCARETRSIQDAVRWRDIGERSLAELLASPEYSPFEKMMMESRFYRSVTYVPFLQRDRDRLASEMTRAEELARTVPAASSYEEFLARENLRACLESRSKESFGFGDDDVGHRRVEEVLRIDPYEPKTHMELGESLHRQGDERSAADCYLRTARLGPIGTVVGYALAGECFAKAGQPLLAEDCFLQALRLDPHAVSCARGWQRVGSANAMAPLADGYLADLEAWGAARRAARPA
jgi:tetratricopeptide (TPR) repeat protein